jgi:hypothetical protein
MGGCYGLFFFFLLAVSYDLGWPWFGMVFGAISVSGE